MTRSGDGPEPFVGDRSGVRVQSVESRGPVSLGANVDIRCRRVVIGARCTIGATSGDRLTRYERTLIECDELHLGDDVVIEPGVEIRGGNIRLGRQSRVGQGTLIDVQTLAIGARGVIHQECELVGRDIAIGRELWMLESAKIGGGSSKEVHSRLRAGDFLHLGVRSLINTADAVTIGHEVGLGTGTCIYTHGAYLSALDGFPVKFAPVSIGDNSWLPGAIVNPGVTIGSNCVIGVGSLVNRDVPDGALALGVPARVVGAPFPQRLSPGDRMIVMRDFMTRLYEILTNSIGGPPQVSESEVRIVLPDRSAAVAYRSTWTRADVRELERLPRLVLLSAESTQELTGSPARLTQVSLEARRVAGAADALSERVLNQLRRYGIRFRYEAVGGSYVPWDARA